MNQVDPPHPMHSPEHVRRMRWLLLIGLMILVIVTFFVWRFHARAQVAQALAAIRAAGFPATGAELDDWYPPVDESENAALVLGAVIDRIAVPPDDDTLAKLPWLGRAEAPKPGESYDTETLAVMRQSLADNATILSEIHRGAGMDRARYPLDLNEGFSLILWHTSGLRKAAHLMAVEAAVHAADGDADGAAKAAGAIFGIAHTLKDEPLLISHLVRIAIDQVGVQVVERMLGRVTPSDQALQRLIQRIDHNEDDNSLQRALAGERVCVSEAFGLMPAQLEDLAGRPAPLLWAHTLAGTLDVDHLVFLDLMGDMVDAAALPADQRQKAFDDVTRRIESLKQFPALLTRQFIGSYDRIVVHDNHTRTMRRLAMAALAVERFRIAEKRLPTGLDEITPKYLDAVPIDPNTGRAVMYKVVGKGFIVYGAGPDKIDDGGKPFVDDEAEPGTDAVFEVTR